MKEKKYFCVNWSDGVHCGTVDFAGDFATDEYDPNPNGESVQDRTNFMLFDTEKEACAYIDGVREENPQCCDLSVSEYEPWAAEDEDDDEE